MKISAAITLTALALPLFSTSPTAHAAQAQLNYEHKANPRPFKGKAKLRAMRRSTSLYTLTVVYPQFLQNTRLTRFANSELRKKANMKYSGFLKNFKTDLSVGNVRKELPYEYSDLPFLEHYVPSRLISTSVFHAQYLGGVHGMEGTYTTNFGFLPGMKAPKVLTLGDLFTGSTYRKDVEQKLFAKVRADKRGVPSFVQDGTVKSLGTNQLNNFTVSSKGLTWYFPPYQLGSYAEGEQEITLSPDELGPNFKRALVLGE
ncbi:DUF3298 domain-containing protein [bacterium]|nr:MAG: DUF3298 domain-containing protein [bacterium]